MKLEQVLPIYYHHRLIVGHPVFHTVTKQSKTLFSKSHKQIDNFLRFPTAIFMVKLHWQIKMMEVKNRSDTLREELINHIIVKSNTHWIHFIGFQILDETGPLNRGAKGIQSRLLHQCDIFSVAIVKVRSHIWPHSVIKNFRFNIVPMIKHIGMFLLKTAF